MLLENHQHNIFRPVLVALERWATDTHKKFKIDDTSSFLSTYGGKFYSTLIRIFHHKLEVWKCHQFCISFAHQLLHFPKQPTPIENQKSWWFQKSFFTLKMKSSIWLSKTFNNHPKFFICSEKLFLIINIFTAKIVGQNESFYCIFQDFKCFLGFNRLFVTFDKH